MNKLLDRVTLPHGLSTLLGTPLLEVIDLNTRIEKDPSGGEGGALLVTEHVGTGALGLLLLAERINEQFPRWFVAVANGRPFALFYVYEVHSFKAFPGSGLIIVSGHESVVVITINGPHIEELKTR